MVPDRCLQVVSCSSRLLRYATTLRLQEQLAADRKAGTVANTLLILQHHPVFTVGKRGTTGDFHTSAEELQQLGIDVHRVPRGGETTYHGPGQLVAYPILDLRQLGLGARAFVEGLEDAMVNTAGCFGIQARGRVPGKTGVWVGERKLGAVGVRITHGISSHGIALNVTTDLSAYKHIVPCGTPDKEVTSLQRELSRGLLERIDSVGMGHGGDSVPLRPAVVDGELRGLLAVAEERLVDSLAQCFDLQPMIAGKGRSRNCLPLR